MRLRYFSDGTVEGTVFRAYQFSWTNTDCLWRHKVFEIDDADQTVTQCQLAWNESMNSNLVHGAVLYCNLSLVSHVPTWAIPGDVVAVIGAHTFYLPKNLRGK
jgi:hypothetical protein